MRRRFSFGTCGHDPAVWMTAIFTPLFVMFIAATSAPGAAEDNPHADVLSIGGSVTEIVYALGQEHRLVARDTTSSFPAAALKLPDVGYIRALSPEGVLSVDPALILSEEGAGPPETIAVLRAASIRFVTVPDQYTPDAILEKIRVVGAALDAQPQADKLIAQTQADLKEVVADNAARTGAPKRVMFVLSTQGGRIMAAGSGTAADAIITLSGAVNAVEGIEGYKQIGDESVGLAAPDVILMMDRSGDHSLSDAALFELPAMQLTPAFETRSVVRMNGLLLLGFGPRTAQAIHQLNAAVYATGG